SPCAGRLCRRTCAISRAARGLRAGPAPGAAAPPRQALLRHGFVSSFGPRHVNSDQLKDLASNNTSSFPRRVFLRPGFAPLLRSPGIEGWAERRETFGCVRGTRGRALGAPQDARERAYDAARQALARRLASHDAGRSPLGAPPWRFFTRGRASVSFG